ncbi:Aldehyde/histidinol dehydrogenase [Aspergillus spectabilis]
MSQSKAQLNEWRYTLPLDHYIHREWASSPANGLSTLHSAMDDSLITNKLACATSAQVELAAQSAEKALPGWQGIKPEERRQLLLSIATIIEENAERPSYLESLVVFKPISMCLGQEMPSLAESFKFEDDLNLSEDGFLRGVLHQPLGVCAAIIPFNSPLITFGMKMAPALVMGNVMIVKPSEYNPLSTLCLGELLTKAGLPPGVVNLVSGAAEAGAALSLHPRIRKISFTGSSTIGRQNQIAAARSNLKRVTLEFGGKSPALTFQDADLDNAVDNAMVQWSWKRKRAIRPPGLYTAKAHCYQIQQRKPLKLCRRQAELSEKGV